MARGEMNRNGLCEGARVEIVSDYYGQADKRISLIGRKGRIRRYRSCSGDPDHMAWDVELDSPLRDRRKFLWCSAKELVLDNLH